MSEEEFALKWNNHESTFLQIIKSLRYKNMYTDVTLACNGKFFSVHKFVLSACSDYFGDIFYQAKGENPVIVLKDVDCKNLEYLLDYMYIGEINVKQKDLASLVSVAECLKIKGLAVPDDTTKINSSYSDVVTNNDFNCEQFQEDSAENFFQSADGEDSFSKSVKSNVVSKNISSEIPLHDGVKVEPLETGLEAKVDNEKEISHFSFVNNLSISCENELQINHTCKENLTQEEKGFSSFGGTSEHFHSFQDDWESNSRVGDAIEEFSPQIFSSEIRPEIPIHLLSSEHLTSSRNIGLKHLKKKFTQLKRANIGFGKKNSYSCPHCTYSCNDKSNFKRHVQVHTGEKPYHCPFCRYSCIHSSNLKTHVRNKHADDLNHSRSVGKCYSLNTQLELGKDSFILPTSSLAT